MSLASLFKSDTNREKEDTTDKYFTHRLQIIICY